MGKEDNLNNFNLAIMTKKEFSYEKNVYQININLENGYFGVFRGIEPIISKIKVGKFLIQEKKSLDFQKVGINSYGLLYMDGKNAKIIFDDFVFADDISIDKIKKEIAKNEKSLNSITDNPYRKTIVKNLEYLNFIYNYYNSIKKSENN